MAGYRSFTMSPSFSILLLGLWLAWPWQRCRGQYPKPSIFVSSTEVVLGGTVTIYCIMPEGFRGAKMFRLYKVDNLNHYILKTMLEDSDIITFQIAHAAPFDGGRYVCQYCSPADLRYCSEPSNIVSLKIIGQAYPKPSIAVVPSGVVTEGQSITIHCENQGYPQAEFFLYKGETSLLYGLRAGQKGNVIFSISNIQQSDGGIYRCRYCYQPDSYKLCSDFSDQVHINMRDPSLPKPSIKVRPKEQISLGFNVTIECWAPESDLNFSLYNSSGLIASQVTKPDGNIAEFPFFMVGIENAGNYTCQYHHRRRPFLWSEPSDPVELLVTSQKQGITGSIGATTIILASSSAALILLLLLLLAFVLCRKRRKGFTTNERNQPMDLPIELNAGVVEPDEITYAELISSSFKTKQTEGPDRSCVYALVAQNKNKASQ